MKTYNDLTKEQKESAHAHFLHEILDDLVSWALHAHEYGYWDKSNALDNLNITTTCVLIAGAQEQAEIAVYLEGEPHMYITKMMEREEIT